ncbi:MAG: DUF3383 family protein, partial [Planctomycetaceae bacterium]|nr:DUF3383 family protein [Planctomycetaceae bacterium]
MQFSLPLTTDVTGFNIPAGQTPTVTLTDSTLFDGDAADTTTTFANSAVLQPFADMNAVQFQAALETVTSVLDEVDGSSLLEAEILLTNGQTLGGMLDVSQIFTNRVLRGLITPGSMQLAVSNDVNRWRAITDGSIGLAVDGETITLHDLDFSGVTSLSGVAALLQTAINSATQRVPDVTVTFQPATTRTDNEGNDYTVPTLTITSSGITLAAAVGAPADVVDDNGAVVGTSLFGDIATAVVDANGAEGTAATPAYSTVQEFRSLIRSLTNNRISDVIFVPASVNSPASLHFQVTIDEQLPDVRTRLDLDELNATHLSNVQTETLLDLSPSLHAELNIGIQLEKIGGGFVLTSATTLASLNAGAGVMLNRDKDAVDQQADGFTDVQVTLHDGTVLEVNFDHAVTISDILNASNSHAANTGGPGPSGRKFEVSIAADQQSLTIVDFTVGESLMEVKAINSSLAPFSLGLVGQTASEDDADTPDINEATTLAGAPLHGRTIADQVMLSDLRIQPSVTLLSQSIDARARHGFIDLHITGDTQDSRSAVTGVFGQTLSFSGSNHSATELLLDLQDGGPLFSSTVAGHVDLHAAAAATGKLATTVSFDRGTTNGSVDVPQNTPLSEYLANGPTTVVTHENADDLNDLADLSFSDITSALSSVSTLLDDLLQTDALGADLPLLGVSVADVVSIGKEISSIVTSLAKDPSASLQQVEELIEDGLGLADQNGVPVFALPELNALAGRSALNVVPDHFQPTRLAAGDPVSMYLRTVDYLATLQNDSPIVTLSIDRAPVTRQVSDYSPDALQEVLDRYDITLQAGQTEFEAPGFVLKLDFALEFTAANSFGASLDHDPSTPGIQVPLHFNLQDLGLNLPSVIDVSGQS